MRRTVVEARRVRAAQGRPVRVLHLGDADGRLARAVERTTSPRAGSHDAHVVHAHEGRLHAGRQMAARLGVPLVATVDDLAELGPGAPPDLVLVPPGAVADDAAALLPAGRWRPVGPLVELTADGRIVGPDIAGATRFTLLSHAGAHAVAADLDAWYGALAIGHPVDTGAPPARPPHVTVVVPTHDRPELLQRTLDALRAQTWPAALWDVVVVDDASTEPATQQVLARAKADLGDQLTVLRSPTNAGAGPSRNRGVAAARGDVIAFTDDDCVPVPCWLEALATAFRDDVGLVQGRTRPEPGVPLGPTARSQWTTAPLGLYETCNIAYRSDALRTVGAAPFDTVLQDRIRRTVGARIAAHGFGEDTDLGWRVRATGAGTRFVHDALVHHHVFTSDVGYLLRRSLLAAAFPVLVDRHPGLRETLLWRRWFLGPRHVWLLVALAGLSLRRPRGLAASVPYLVELVEPHRPGRRDRLRAAPLRALRDAVELASLAYGSVRARTVVL